MQVIFSFHRIPTILVLILLLTGCDAMRYWGSDTGVRETVSVSEKQVLSVRNRATTIQSAIYELQRRDMAPFRIGDTLLTVTIYFENGQIRLIDERVEAEETGSARNRYYFDEASLFHFFGKSSPRINPGEPEAQFANIRTRMYFNAAGNLFDYEHKINDIESKLAENELPSVMQRSVALSMLVNTDSLGRIDTAAFVGTLYRATNGTYTELPPMELTEKPNEANATSTRDTVKPQAKSPAQQPAQQPTKTVVKIVSSPPPQPPAVKKASPPRAQQPVVKKASTPPAQQPAKPAVKKASTPPVQQPAKQAVKKASTPPVQQPAKQAVKKASTPPAQQPAKQAMKKASTPPAQQPMVKKASPPAEIAGADDADAFIETHVHAMLPGTLNIHRMRFQKGSTSASYSTQVS
ncbi:MAG: hypothetical protein WC824_13865, partial [Bacteroidota bacterium]